MQFDGQKRFLILNRTLSLDASEGTEPKEINSWHLTVNAATRKQKERALPSQVKSPSFQLTLPLHSPLSSFFLFLKNPIPFNGSNSKLEHFDPEMVD